VIEAAAHRSIGLQGLRRYRLHGAAGPAGIVIGFGNLNEEAIRTGISTVADLLQQ
jgi:GntR family transcriptional regulator/MocR family aminotransferase